MEITTIAIIIFLILEGLNIGILYFFPGTDKGNGLGAFKAFEASKADPDVHALVRYLVNWVAGSKLIFVALLIVIAWHGDARLQAYCLVAMVIAIATFYWRLYPIIRALDAKGQIAPRGYSKTLFVMITAFILGFVAVLVKYFFFA